MLLLVLLQLLHLLILVSLLQDRVHDRPKELVTLRQWWQLMDDCGIISARMHLADSDRLFLFSNRESIDKSGDASGKTWKNVDGNVVEISNVDELDPHNSSNEAHIYEFVEALLRVAHLVSAAPAAAAAPAGGASE